MKRYILKSSLCSTTLNQALGISEILRENFRYGDIIFENNPISFQYLIIIQIINYILLWIQKVFKNRFSVKTGIEFGLFYGFSAQVVGALF